MKEVRVTFSIDYVYREDEDRDIKNLSLWEIEQKAFDEFSRDLEYQTWSSCDFEYNTEMLIYED